MMSDDVPWAHGRLQELIAAGGLDLEQGELRCVASSPTWALRTLCARWPTPRPAANWLPNQPCVGTHGECTGKQHGHASSLHCINVYGIIVHDWWPSLAALTTLIPWGASATPWRSQPLQFIYPGEKPTSCCQREEKP
jgi:hypothetical protein